VNSSGVLPLRTHVTKLQHKHVAGHTFSREWLIELNDRSGRLILAGNELGNRSLD